MSFVEVFDNIDGNRKVKGCLHCMAVSMSAVENILLGFADLMQGCVCASKVISLFCP